MKHKLFFKELRDYIISNEPRLSKQEKLIMWGSIIDDYQRYNRQRKYIRWSVAASITLLLAFGFMEGYHRINVSTDRVLFSRTDVNSIKQVELVMGDNKVTLEKNCIIRCNSDKNCIEIEQDASKLAISYNSKTKLLVAVPSDAKAEVILSDGSDIVLREKTKMSFPFSLNKEKNRNVKIEGEAYMAVTHMPKKKFLVDSKYLHVTVLGTKFLLSVYPESKNQKVSLFEGLVQVTTDTKKEATLKPNQTFDYHLDDGHTHVYKIQNSVKNSTSLNSDLLIMNNESLTKLLHKAEEYYQTKFYFNPSETDGIKLTGKFDTQATLEVFLSRLEKIAPVQVSKQGKRIIIHK